MIYARNNVPHLQHWFLLQGGVMLLFLTLCIQTGYKSAAKKLSVDIGGSKRLNALSTFASALILLPWALFISMTREVGFLSFTLKFITT